MLGLWLLGLWLLTLETAPTGDVAVVFVQGPGKGMAAPAMFQIDRLGKFEI